MPKPSIIRYERGMPRSDMFHRVWWVASVCRATKSQKVSRALWACGISRSGCGLPAWMTSGNLMASWMKKTGMLLPTRSKVPSVVQNFVAKPRVSRTVSVEPREPSTVEKRTKTGVLTSLPRNAALVMWLAVP